MKFNWGTGIAIFYGCFMIAMISMVVKSCQHQSHLVEEEYYQKDLNYESFRLKRINGDALKNEIHSTILNKSNELQVSFPKNMTSIKGELMFYRPSNKYLDQKHTLKLDSNNTMKIKLDQKFPKGLWTIQLDWSNKSISYYNELALTL